MIEVHIGESASYTASGVNTDAGDRISSLWQQAARQTYHNRKDTFGKMAVEADAFSDIRGIDVDALQEQPGLILNLGVDGAGTKPELAERATDRRIRGSIPVLEEGRDHQGIFKDVTAMVADDISRDGGEPIAIATLFDARSLSAERALPIVEQLCEGAVEACKLANVVYPNGETAELNERVGGYGPFNYNLGAFAVGLTHKTRTLTGEKIKPGDSIVALRELGFRSNGMTLVRKILAAEFGDDWHLEEEDIATQALRPSLIYTKAFVEMHGGYDLINKPKAEVNAIVHVTGGGIPGKLQRKLGVNGYGAVLPDLFKPPEIMRKLQEWSRFHDGLNTSDADMYQALNAGNGALVIGPEPNEVIHVARHHGFEAQVAGEVVAEPGIEIKSKGVTDNGEWIRYIPRGA